MRLEKSDVLKTEVLYWDKLNFSHPDKTYTYLYNILKSHVDKLERDSNRTQLEGKVVTPALPAMQLAPASQGSGHDSLSAVVQKFETAQKRLDKALASLSKPAAPAVDQAAEAAAADWAAAAATSVLSSVGVLNIRPIRGHLTFCF